MLMIKRAEVVSPKYTLQTLRSTAVSQRTRSPFFGTLATDDELGGRPRRVPLRPAITFLTCRSRAISKSKSIQHFASVHACSISRQLIDQSCSWMARKLMLVIAPLCIYSYRFAEHRSVILILFSQFVGDSRRHLKRCSYGKISVSRVIREPKQTGRVSQFPRIGQGRAHPVIAHADVGIFTR